MPFAGLSLFAIVLAAVVSFMFGWLWYGVLFSKQWMNACGKTEADLKAGGGPSPVPFVVSFVALLVMAGMLAALLSHLAVGGVTLKNGLAVGFFVWLGFVITTMAVNHAFQGFRPVLTVIDGGHWLGVLLLQGAIIGLIGVST